MVAFDDPNFSPPHPRFDPRQHITAGELREIGFLLCENIADDAFVRRAAVGLDARERCDEAATANLRLRVYDRFREPELSFSI